MNTLDTIDKALMLWLNSKGAPWLDPFMVFVSSQWGWLPWYLFLVGSLWYFYGWKTALIGLLGCAASVTLTDQISVYAFKEVFQRLRPCHQEDLVQWLRVVDGCGGQYGFVSSHAANTAGVAAFLYRLLPKAPFTQKLLIFWAALVAYSRVYLGVHFPGDILVGALMGVGIGTALAIPFLRLPVFEKAKAS